MKNDSSRNTFNSKKHFSSVRMQQGRVQVDADWNEACDIITHLANTETLDVIGPCGGPMHDPAFHIVTDLGQLSTEEQKLAQNQNPPKGFKPPDFFISAGRYYVDGILCENELLTSYLNQPDLPAAVALKDAGLYLVYVDVWQRHLTALDDPSIREIALGGPDTATRAKTVWQVKYFSVKGKGNCVTQFPEFEKFIAAGDGKLSARTRQEKTSSNPCIVPPGAGYTGLENQLYRVEVHGSGDAFDVTTGGAGTLVTRVPGSDNQVKFPSGAWKVDDAVEIFSTKVGSDPMNGTLAYVTNVDSGSKTLTLDVDVTAIALDELRLRPIKATYKWSRNNAFVATAIESINVIDQEITVQDLGPDAVLGFKEGQWVEISDDRLELNGLPGQLIQIVKIDPAINLITLGSKPTALSAKVGGVDKSLHPKLRGWEGIAAIKFHPNASDDHFLDLESGVQVRFFAGAFKSGDYWTIPARTATADAQSGNIEWPSDAGNKPLAQLPFGIKHHYCRLAMLRWDGEKFGTLEDCRHLFPPITELTSLFFVSGDGQESMPNDPLPQLLQCSVFNGAWPVAGAQVRFVAQGSGRLALNIAGLAASATNTISVVTGPDGIASCAWLLEADVKKHSQQVEARLLDANSDPLPPVVRFNGNLSIAEQVFYDPGPCATLKGDNTVQKAIDRLADLVSLYEVSGNDQEVMPGTTLEPLKVLVANRCGPVRERKVRFEVIEGTGNLNSTEAITDANGIATNIWTLDDKTPRQQVEVSLVDEPAQSIAAPTAIRFTANLSIASQVAYDPNPEECPDLAKANVKTVKEALDELCKRTTDAEPGIRIKHILSEGNGRKDLQNDTLVEVSRLSKGITIICDGRIVPESVGPSPDPKSAFPDAAAAKPTCFVTLDLPYPIGADRNFWGEFNKIVGYQPLVLAASVSVAEQEMRWTPTRDTNNWLQKLLFATLTKNQIADRVLAHLTLKGNYIWSLDDNKKELYLDANAFGTLSAQDRIDLRLPTGDRRKGGDFEMWFWLFQPGARSGVVLTTEVNAFTISGSVHDSSGGVIPGAQVTTTNAATGKQVTVATGPQGKFFVQVTPGTYRVHVEFGGDSDEDTVVVVSP
jgi:hypothetical protein